MPRYALSTRQQKELAPTQGKLLRIVLPIPEEPSPDGDWLAWARSVLEVAPQYVRRAREGSVLGTAGAADRRSVVTWYDPA